MTRDCGHSTGDGQRLRTQYRRWSETADTVQEMTRDCRHDTGAKQILVQAVWLWRTDMMRHSGMYRRAATGRHAERTGRSRHSATCWPQIL
ncbi:unnamed protein product [Staurois parvus]|uniref:Uncharacterized protein n=1 Tax=Staurois parvus TaxID=386267 RepID=A0ABN9DTG8_9NEOB|nr:unnamed protein product [Staurois parvus]